MSASRARNNSDQRSDTLLSGPDSANRLRLRNKRYHVLFTQLTINIAVWKYLRSDFLFRYTDSN